MSVKTVFLYAGQGSQKVGMGKDIYEEFAEYREVLDSIHVSVDVKKLMEEGPMEELTLTENTQPCMSAFAAGVTNVLKAKGICADAACGLSLGEYGALHCAGVINAEEYVEITAYRGKVMAEAAKGHMCSMSAVLGLESSKVEEACEACKNKGFVTVANYNCPGQYVICGDEEAVCAAEECLKNEGAKKCIRLKVSGPFHTKYMEPAGEKLRERLETIPFQKPQIPLVLNVTGDFYDETTELKDILKMQIQSSVRFEELIRKLMEQGADTFVEIGPGNALTGFVKKTAKAEKRKITTYYIDTAENLRKVIENLA